MAGMRGKADAAAHHDAIHERDIGLWKRGDPGVEDVLLTPEYLAEIAAGPRALIEAPDIAARAQSARASAFQQDQRHFWVGLERVERRHDAASHLQRQRVQRFRPVETDHAGRALAPHDQIGLGTRNSRGGGRHRAPSISLRETISRMISLVPSRIWCTRRSRTIFSMP